MKNNIISESDIIEILSMHKSLREQNQAKAASDLSADLVQLRKAITAGCLKGGKILTQINDLRKQIKELKEKEGKKNESYVTVFYEQFLAEGLHKNY